MGSADLPARLERISADSKDRLSIHGDMQIESWTFNLHIQSPLYIAVRSFQSASSAIIVARSKSMTTTNTPDNAAVTEHPKLIRTYRTRAYLSRAGHVRLDDVLAQQCLLYNAALEERRTAWKQHHQRISLAEQSRSLTAIRSDFPDIEGSLHRRIQDATLKRLDRAVRGVPPPSAGGRGPRTSAFQVLQALEDSRNVLR